MRQAARCRAAASNVFLLRDCARLCGTRGVQAPSLYVCAAPWQQVLADVDCYTPACLVSRADTNYDGMLVERELDAFDGELIALARTLPGFRAAFECRAELPRHPTTVEVRAAYVACRLPGIRLD